MVFNEWKRWNSHGLDCIHSEQKCGHSTMVDKIEGQIFQHDLLKWNPNVFIVDDINV